MVSSAITPTRTIAVLIGVAVIAVAGFLVVRSGVFEPETVQGAIPGPGSSSPSASVSESSSAPKSPEASASPTTPQQIKAKNIADAKARLVEYYATTAAVANDGYKDWRGQLVPYWGSFAIRDAMSAAYTQSAKLERYTTGSAEIESTSVTSYLSSENDLEEVGLEVCVDFSNVETFDANSNIIPRSAGSPERYYLGYQMRHHGDGRGWAIDEGERYVGRAC